MGRLLQDRSPDSEEFRIRLELQQEGMRVWGKTYITVADCTDYYATMVLEGKLYGATFVFEETKILEENHPLDWDWCLKNGRMELRRHGDFLRLEGVIGGRLGNMDCAPGDSQLERLDPIKKPVPAPVAEKTPAKPVPAPQPSPQPTPAPKPQPSAEKIPASPEKPNYGSLAGRKIDHQRQIEVYQRELTVYVWDADKVDGDVVSLSFNGDWLLEKYAIEKEKRAIKLKVVPGGDNRLILYAENEGTFPPNTAAITFYDGRETRHLNLTSNKSTCGALEFVFRQ